MIKFRECGNAEHLTDENGNFKSTFDIPKDTMCIGKLEEAMQWVFYQKEFEDDDKLKRILKLEEVAQHLLGGINYVPYWSKKLNE
jgi:hypothetical protein